MTPRRASWTPAKEPEYTEDEIMKMASAEQVGVNADETAAAAADTDPAACLEDCWPPADRVGNTSWCECGKCVVQLLRNDCICCKDVPESAAADWLLSLAALLAPHSSRKAAATSTHCTLYCVAIWARSISRPDRSHLSLETGTC